MLTEGEHFYRRWYASLLIICAFFSGVAGLYITPLFMGVMVYLTVARRRLIAVDAALIAAKVVIFIGGAACLAADIKYLRQGV